MKSSCIVPPGVFVKFVNPAKSEKPLYLMAGSLFSILTIASERSALGEGVYWKESNQKVAPCVLTFRVSVCFESVKVFWLQSTQLFSKKPDDGMFTGSAISSKRHSH